MRDSEGFDDLQVFEKVLAGIAFKCEYSYGAMGRVGFLYDSMKDRLKWGKLSIKHYVKLISQVGQILSMSEDDYKKEKRRSKKISKTVMFDVFKSAFGDGKDEL